MTTGTQPLSHFIGALAGPIIWAAHFFFIYGAEALVCTRSSFPVSTMVWIVGTATALALVALMAWLVRHSLAAHRDEVVAVFLHLLSVILVLISGGAVIAQALPILRLSACT